MHRYRRGLGWAQPQRELTRAGHRLLRRRHRQLQLRSSEPGAGAALYCFGATTVASPPSTAQPAAARPSTAKPAKLAASQPAAACPSAAQTSTAASQSAESCTLSASA